MRFVTTLAVLVLLSGAARGASLTPQEASEMYTAALSLMKMEAPKQAPTIHLVKVSDLREMVHCPDCGIQGVQLEGDIWMDADLDFSDIHVAAVLLHEMVHYLQFIKSGESTTCEDWLDREREAFSMQIMWLLQHNQNVQMERMALSQYSMAMCKRINPGDA